MKYNSHILLLMCIAAMSGCHKAQIGSEVTSIQLSASEMDILRQTSQQGSQIVVMFALSPTCGPCTRAAGQFRSLMAEVCIRAQCRAVPLGTSTIGIKSYLNDQEMPNLPLADLGQEIRQRVGLRATPTIIVVPPDGQTIHLLVGAPSAFRRDLRSLVGLTFKTEFTIWLKSLIA